MERPEVVDPLKEEEQPILQQTPVEKPEPIDTQTDDAFSVRGLAEKRLGKLGTGALDFVPIAGDILAAGDVVESYKKGDVLGTAINSAAFAVGLIPVVGDVAAKGLKAGLKATRAEKSDVPDIWSYPEQMYSSSGTSQNQIAAGYNELKRRGELKKGDKVVDIGGGRFDNLINDASEEGIDVKVFDPFNRTPEHNAAVADAVREGQADVAMSHNVLNVIKEDANIKTVIQQAENAVKPGGKAHFTVYEGNRSGVGGTTKAKTKTQTDQSFQRNQKTEDYVPFVEEIFGANNVTRKGKIITAVKRIVFDFKSPKGTVFKRGGKFGGLNFPVGKVIGGNQVYFHKNYIGSQPKEVQDLYNSALDKLPPDHNFNTLMYMKGKGDTPDTIRFDESADFDFAREPTPGKMVAIDANGNVANRSSNQIFHHKWMWVGDDYKGFDVNKEYNWSKQWTSKVDNFSGIGKKENWDRILEEKGLELDAPTLNFKKTSTDASNTFGEGVKRVTYTDPESGGNIAIIDRSAQNKTSSIVELFVPEKARRKGIGKAIVKKAMEDYPNIMGQVSSKTAAKNAYDLGRRPVTKPDATLEEVFKMIEENSSVNLASKQAIKDMQLNKGGAIKTYKEGGVVPMQEQMKFAFMNEGGVLADDGVERDPVSGNEVPAGSMAEEVRDDVPAMLSEGEYVVPADVVRYHGIDKFEELRDEAKRGLARMEADGRIGGQPVEEQEEFPFPVEELEGFQEGGAVGDIYEDVMGQPYIPPQDQESSYVARGRFPGTGFELRNFTNPRTGRTVVIPFFNGKPMQYIPPDFLEGGASTQQTGTFDPVADDRDRQEREAERARTPTDSAFPLPSGFPQDTQAGPRSFAEYTPEDWSRYISQTDSTLADITAKVPVLGFIQRMNENAARNYAESALRSGKNPATGQELTLTEKNALGRVLATSRNTGIIEAVKNYITGARGSITGVPLFEQAGFEKDLLPFEPRPQDTAPQTVDSDLEEFNKRYGPVEESDLDAFEQIATDTNQYLDQTQQVAFAPERSFAELEQTFQPDREGREFVWTVLPGRFGNAQRKVRVEDAYLLGTNALANIDTGNIQGMMPRVTSTGDDDAPVLSASVLKRNIRGDIPKARDVQEEIKANIEANRFQPRQAGILENLFGFAGPAYGAPEFTDSGVLANDAYRDMSNFEKKYVNLATKMGYVGSLDGMIAKMRHETNNGENENLYNYTSKNILNTFGAIRTSAEAVKLVADANQAYNRTGNMQDYKFVVAEGVYGMNTPVGSKELGNKQPFDGAIFTGRSQSQTTGRFNYSEVSKILYNNFPEQFTRPDFLTTLTRSEFDFYSQNVPTNLSQQERYARALDNKLDDIVADPDKALKFNVGYAVHHQNMNPDTVGDPRKVIEKFGGTKASKDKALKELEKIQSKGGLQTKVSLDPSKLKEEVGKGAIKITKPPLKKPEEIDYIAPMPSVNFAEYEQDRQISAPEPLVGAELFRERERQRAEMQGGLRSQPIAQPTEEATPEFIDPIRRIAAEKEERDALIKGGQRLASLDDQMQEIESDISPQPFTPLGKPSDISRLMPSASDIEAQKAADARKLREQQEKRIYEESQKRMAEQMKEAQAQPKEQPKAEPTQLEKTRAKQAMGTGRSREEARQEADKVLQQTGDAFAADRAYHEAFTGFTSSGELSPSFGFKEGGLASRPKKTKPKKRTTKKGLGARMAT